MEHAAEINKARNALLRMVSCWLIATLIVRITRRILPRLISRYVDEAISKVEASAGYLLIAANGAVFTDAPALRTCLSAAAHHRAFGRLQKCGHNLTLDEIIARLKAVKAALRHLAKSTISARPKTCTTRKPKYRFSTAIKPKTEIIVTNDAILVPP